MLQVPVKFNNYLLFFVLLLNRSANSPLPKGLFSFAWSNVTSGWRRWGLGLSNNWLYTTNHRKIAVNYFLFVLVSGTAGLALATAMRLEFAYPGMGAFAGDSLQYLTVASAHGVVMVFFMIIPLLFGAFANFLLPTQLGVHDVAFPRLNSAAFWFLPGGLFLLAQMLCTDRRFFRMNCFNMPKAQSLLKQRFFLSIITEEHLTTELPYLTSSLHEKINALIDSNILTTLRFNPLHNKSLYTQLAYDTHYSNGENLFQQVTTPSWLAQVLDDLIYYDTIVFYEKAGRPWEFSSRFLFIGDNSLSAWLSFSFFIGYVIPFIVFISAKDFDTAMDNAWDFYEYCYVDTHSLLYLSLLTSIRILLVEWGNLFYNWVILEKITWISSIRGHFAFYAKLGFCPDSVLLVTSHFQDVLFYNNLIFEYLRSILNQRAGFAQNEVPGGLEYDGQTANVLNLLTPQQRYYQNWAPICKYNFKFADYYTKSFRENTFNLLPSSASITNALRLPHWFSNAKLVETVAESNNQGPWLDNFLVFTTNSIKLTALNLNLIQWASAPQKYKHFLFMETFQLRLLANWRHLRLTREAWRCKALLSRHQKSAYRRYINEKTTFWTIDRNARDLLPGWALITPFSTRPKYTTFGKVDLALFGVFLTLNSSIISSANFLLTYRYLSTLNNRKMRDARAFFTEGVIVSSWMMIAANPMLIIGIIMLLADRHWQTSFFDYSGGGDAILFQHMFWFFGHPEVYIIMLPVFGFTNTILSYSLRKRISARASLIYSMYTIAFLGFFVWGHHMYMVGLAHTTRMLFSTLTVMISVPAATKLMHWCVTIVNSSITIELPLLLAFTFIFFFVSGGISGMCVAHTGMDILFHDTFYVIGHFHIMLAGAAMLGSFGAFYFYFGSIFGVKYSRFFAYLHCSFYLLGQILTLAPMFWLGYMGMPRRVLDYPASMGGWHSFISGGHLLTLAGVFAFFCMFLDSVRRAKTKAISTFGVPRFNTRLNSYLFIYLRIRWNLRKSGTLLRVGANHKRNLKFQKWARSVLISPKFK